jgi:hypothetical protein
MLNELLAYLELAVDGEPSVEPTPSDQAEGTQVTEPVQTETVPTETFFEIDGEKLTPQQIKEYRQGYLRQSDYTKKTQEIANLRKENNEALELYNYFRANPHLAQKLAEMDDDGAKDINNVYKHTDPKIVELDTKFKVMEINHELELLKMQDPNVNEIDILTLANEKAMPIKDAYTLWRGLNFDKIMKDTLAKQSASLTQQIKNSNSTVTTLMNPNDKTNDNNFGLSEAEMRMAEKLDMTYEEYKRWS